jgi:hypothetical protein
MIRMFAWIGCGLKICDKGRPQIFNTFLLIQSISKNLQSQKKILKILKIFNLLPLLYPTKYFTFFKFLQSKFPESE